MAKAQSNENTNVAGQIATDGSEVAETIERRKVDVKLRPVFAEVARLSATLGIARNACYEGNPNKALNALRLLVKQAPQAVELAELLAPTGE